MQILVNSIYIEYEDYGDNADPALVLIRWLGSQLIHWPKNLINGLVEAGYRVIIFDNRDIGLSSRCPLNGVSYDKQSIIKKIDSCLLYTSPSPRDKRQSRMPSSA